ncbi:MAG: hypothetical protein DWH91_02460 [Planctomycetota bacterium]|nr:MAG: hypothetical protein DWH91_02460 [Planctomycetota bacterium]
MWPESGTSWGVVIGSLKVRRDGSEASVVEASFKARMALDAVRGLNRERIEGRSLVSHGQGRIHIHRQIDRGMSGEAYEPADQVVRPFTEKPPDGPSGQSSTVSPGEHTARESER